MNCPDCQNGQIDVGGRCDVCGLSWDAVVAGAERYDRIRREAIVGPRPVEMVETCPQCRGTGSSAWARSLMASREDRPPCGNCRGTGRVRRSFVPRRP